MKLKQLHTVVLPLKLKSDGAMLTRKKDLQEAYVACKGRDLPVFHFAIVREDEDTKNGGLDREGMSDNITIGNNEDDGTQTVDNNIIKVMLELGAVMEV